MSSNNNNNNIEGQPPAAKRQRRSLGASDRVVLDVGGTKFITSASTLTSNSAYFASLLSDNWIESNIGDDEIFIDQIPSVFSILLDYMRRGSIKIKDVDTDVIFLAEFLGIERLLLAIKVRWYCNIGKGPVVATDDEIAVAFDQEHGGIMKAISSGLFQYFLKQNDIDAEKEFATFHISRLEAPGARPQSKYKLKEIGKPGPERNTGGISGALNGLHLKGYTHHESQLKTNETYTFSRRKHITVSSSGVTDIFIPNDNETVVQEKNGHIKQFASVWRDLHDTNIAIAAPAEFYEDESKRSNPLRSVVIVPGPSWLEENGFVTREDTNEHIFKEHRNLAFKEHRKLADKLKEKIFSRVISKERDDASW